MQPTGKLTPDEWAAKHRIYPPSAGIPGPRNPKLTPYAIPFARATYEANNKRVVMVTSAQSGKTDTMLDIIGSRMDQKPVPMLYAGPTQAFVTDQFEPRLTALFDEAKTLKLKVAGKKKNKKTQKWVGGVKIRLAYGGSSAALKSDPFGMALVDEYDEMLADVKGQGDPLGLIEARGDTYADFTTAIASTPSRGRIETVVDEKSGLEFWREADPIDIESGIWKLWQSGTRHHWCWPCPQCGDYFVPRFKQLRYPKGATPTIALREAFIECPHCGGVIEEKHKADMNARGRYVAPGQWVTQDGVVHGEPAETTTLSYWVSGLASPFRTFGQRAETYLLALESGDQEKIQTALNAGFGECFSEGAGDAPEWEEVYALRQPYPRGSVPKGVRFLTCGADVQQNRIVFSIRGWGARQESWLIDHGEIWGDTGQKDVWDDFADLLHTEYDGFQIRKAFIDSGYKPKAEIIIADHMVYEFCRVFGRVATAAKGYERRQSPITMSKIEITTRGEKFKYGLEVALLDTDYMKSFVHQRIRWAKDQPGGWHLHIDADESYCRQVTAEARVRKPNGAAEWVVKSRNNHFLDAEMLAYAAAWFCGVHRIKGRPSPNVTPELVEPPDDSASRVKREAPVRAPRIPTTAIAKTETRSDRFSKWAGRFDGL